MLVALLSLSFRNRTYSSGGSKRPGGQSLITSLVATADDLLYIVTKHYVFCIVVPDANAFALKQ